MADFEAIDALLALAKQETPLPPVEERRPLREALNVSRARLAQALGVGVSTVGGWESGRDPSGDVREKYAYFLEGARTRLAPTATTATTGTEPAAELPQEPAQAEPDPAAATDTDPATELPQEPAEADEPAHPAHPDDLVGLVGLDDVDELAVPRPCVLCGQPARHQVEGFPQHLDPADCNPARTVPAAQPVPTAQPVPAAEPAPKPAGRTGTRRPPTVHQPVRQAGRGVKVVPVGRRMQTADTPDLIASAVTAVLAQHAGDVEAATAALVKRAIPDAMILLDHTRKGGRYDVVAHPWLPDVLRKQTARGADQVWEARPKWARPELPPGVHEVTALDINGAYLSALKTHLPLGQLEHSTGDLHDRRRAGIHLITPPAWNHDTVLPNPIGNRDEAGPLWITEPTLRLLLRISSPTYGLCEPPVIHESWTSGATEGLLEKFRITLKDARDTAIADGDDVTLEYVKAMYSKFVSTMGESNYNRELYRTDWMHLIRSQAFANLWWKAHRAYDEGLMVVRAMGTDELHVAGDWRAIFPEGRGVTEVKVKDVYAVGHADPATPEEA
ncbi:helix-turn-helix domain-containing protein [Streptomyces sp. cg40]|uniref:helix-turn-helix domain-containing protein n=1 Tax=Streptomyces sp. cg40 TaxID=3419764 RepID=UPI003D018E71